MTETIIFSIDPLDTLFFRDGAPFNAGEGGNNVLASIFPPYPPTVVGALRAALARSRGWIEGDWNVDLKQVLGNRDVLGELSFAGPYVLRASAPLFPTPMLLLRQDSLTRLVPGKPLDCDLGSVIRLPVPANPREGLRDLSGTWLTSVGMKTVLDGGVPDAKCLVASESLWSVDERTGIGRNNQTGVVNNGALYSTRHIRLACGVQIAMQVEGLPDEWAPQNPAPVGGESRIAWITPSNDRVALPSCPRLSPGSDGKLRYTVTLITPALLDPSALRSGIGLPDLPGVVVSASIGKATRLGGWDTERKSPLAGQSLIPAGSTWFVEAEGGDASKAQERHGKHLGDRSNWGFGQILIGVWREGNA